MKNPQLQSLIIELKKASIENKVNLWKRIASDLEKPVRLRREVNISKIQNYSDDNDYVLVPGKVLSMGELTKKVTIAAFSFSSGALEKIKASGSKAVTIKELLAKNPKGSKVKILG